jgi:serine protease AprX
MTRAKKRIVRFASVASACLTAIGLATTGAGAAVPSNAETISVAGSDVVVKLWTDRNHEGDLAPHYAIAHDGTNFTEPQTTSYLVKLRYAEFDPLGPDLLPAVAPEVEAGDDTNLYIVQFVTHPLEAYRAAIRDLGGIVRNFLPDDCHIVEMDPTVLDAVEGLPFVRWVGAFHPAYRLEEFMVDNVDRAEELYPLLRYNIMLFESSEETKNAVADAIEALGGLVDSRNSGKYLITATLTPEQLFAVARMDDVLFIDRWGPYEADMDKSRELSGANYLEDQAGYTGQDVRGEVFDLGFNLNHVDFASRPLIQHGAVGPDTHGAATSGIVFGDGTGNPNARGVLPSGQGIVADLDTVGLEGPGRYANSGELLDLEAVFQTASVGSPRTTSYTTISADTDAMIFDFDLLHCQSQSNAGTRNSRPQAWAKNIVSGGGVYHYDTLTRDDDCWCGGASIGPASDGRIKPDLCHFYDDTLTTTCCGPTDYTFSFGGTSGATPNICGYTGLFFQMWSEGIFGNEVDPLGSVFDNRPHAATAKAVMINTATQYPFSGAGHDLTRVHQGWGMPDVRTIYDLRNKMFIIDETDPLRDGDSILYTVEVSPGEPELKATMVYRDPPGTPNSSVHRINDLSLRVTSPSGDMYWGNNGLLETMYSTTGGVANEVDTVENVFVQNPEQGMWTIEVFGMEVVAETHEETFGVLDADFALVVSGVVETLPPLVLRVLTVPPTIIPPGVETEIEVEILEGSEIIVPGTELAHYRLDPADEFVSMPLQPLGDNHYLATIPGADCDETPQFYFSVEGDGGTVISNPPNAPESFYEIPTIGEIITIFEDDFEFDNGWTVENVGGLTDGAWERGVPAGGGDRGDPPVDADGSGRCYVTDNADGNSDVDDGSTILTSPDLDASNPAAAISYYRWYSNTEGDNPMADIFVVEVSDDGGNTWVELEVVGPGGSEVSGGWFHKEFLIADIAGIANSEQFRIRFTASDLDGGSVVEAGVDGVEISYFNCDELGIPGDVNGDGAVDINDLLQLLAAWGDCPDPPADCPEDLNDDGVVDIFDLLELLANWGG